MNAIYLYTTKSQNKLKGSSNCRKSILILQWILQMLVLFGCLKFIQPQRYLQLIATLEFIESKIKKWCHYSFQMSTEPNKPFLMPR